jgi:hypothetical protein
MTGRVQRARDEQREVGRGSRRVSSPQVRVFLIFFVHSIKYWYFQMTNTRSTPLAHPTTPLACPNTLTTHHTPLSLANATGGVFVCNGHVTTDTRSPQHSMATTRARRAGNEFRRVQEGSDERREASRGSRRVSSPRYVIFLSFFNCILTYYLSTYIEHTTTA